MDRQNGKLKLAHYLWLSVALVLVVAGCGPAASDAPPSDKAPRATSPIPEASAPVPRPAEEWVSKPYGEWPQIVLTNDARFSGHTSLQGASSFLIQTDDERILAATAAHLIGAAGGVEPEIEIAELDEKVASWKMHPRTVPDSAIEIIGVGVEGLRGYPDRDWLVLSVADPDMLPATPLKLRREPVQVGETVFLIGCPYVESNCSQNVYRGTVTERGNPDLFRYDLDPPVDLRGFSGAPIVDEKGYLVGVMTVWFRAETEGEKYLEGGGEDASWVHELLHH